MATYQLISSVTVGSGGASSIDFTSIPATYTDLVVKLSARTTNTGSNWQQIRIGFNGTSNTTNWNGRDLYGTGSGTASYSYTSDNDAGGWSSSADTTASTFANTEIYIPNYTGSTNKSISTDSTTENNATSALTLLTANLWSNSSAITSIALTPLSGNFAQHSTAYLYGIKSS